MLDVCERIKTNDCFVYKLQCVSFSSVEYKFFVGYRLLHVVVLRVSISSVGYLGFCLLLLHFARVQPINQSTLFTTVTLESLLRLKNLEYPSDSGSNWDFEMLVFEQRENRSTRKKISRNKDENQEQTYLPTYNARSGNRARATLVGD